MQPDDFFKTLDERASQDTADTKESQRSQLAVDNTQQVVDKITEAVQMLMAFQAQHQPKVQVTNQKLPTTIKTPDVQLVVDALENLKQPLQDNKPDDTKIIEALSTLNDSISKLPTDFPEIPEPIEIVTVKNQPDYKPDFKAVTKAISSIDVKPIVNIPEDKPDDYTPILDELDKVVKAVQEIQPTIIPETDLTPLVMATQAVQESINNLRFPVPNYVLPFKDSNGKAIQVSLNTDGTLPTSTSGLVTSSYDYLALTQASTTDTYTYYSGGVAGTLVATVTITYTDSTKTTIANVART